MWATPSTSIAAASSCGQGHSTIVGTRGLPAREPAASVVPEEQELALEQLHHRERILGAVASVCTAPSSPAVRACRGSRSSRALRCRSQRRRASRASRSEAMLQILTGRGASPADAMTYAALIDRHIFGSALQHVEERGMERRYGVTDSGQVANAITAVRDLATASGDYPTLSTWMADPHVATPTEQFDLSLGFLLDGIAAQLRQRERI